MRKSIVLMVFALTFFLFLSPVHATITCSGTDSTKTIAVGEMGDITVSCSGISQGTTVTVNAQYSSTCLSAKDAIPFSLTYDNPSAQITFEATSMSCQYNSNERTITWSFTAPGESISSQQTLVTITSPISVTASFKNAPYSATAGESVTVILEISTGASVDITDVDADMTTSPTISDITDWNDNTIYSSGSQKTIQKSWTFNAPSAGTYTISTTVTSQNAGGDQESTTLTVTSAGGQAPGGEEGPGGGVGGPSVEKAKNATRRPELVPGVGLRNNTKLLSAIEKVLARGKLSENAIDNLIRLSNSITSQVEVVRNFEAKDGRSELSLRMKYKGDRKVKNFIIYDKIPKTFASHASNVTVTASGAKIEIVEEDPEYVFLYDEVSPDQELVITYSVNQEVDVSVINETETYVFGESYEGLAPGQVCIAGDKRCIGNDLQQCKEDGTGWETLETCEYGCDSETLTCKEAPKEEEERPPVTVEFEKYWMWIVIGIVIVVVVVLAGIFIRKRRKKSLKLPKPMPEMKTPPSGFP